MQSHRKRGVCGVKEKCGGGNPKKITIMKRWGCNTVSGNTSEFRQSQGKRKKKGDAVKTFRAPKITHLERKKPALKAKKTGGVGTPDSTWGSWCWSCCIIRPRGDALEGHGGGKKTSWVEDKARTT